MKTVNFVLCLLLANLSVLAQSGCIDGPESFTGTATYSAIQTAQCADCYFWTINPAVNSGTAIVGSNTGSSVQVNAGVMVGNYDLCLTYFVNGECVQCCIPITSDHSGASDDPIGDPDPSVACECYPDIEGELICRNDWDEETQMYILVYDHANVRITWPDCYNDPNFVTPDSIEWAFDHFYFMSNNLAGQTNGTTYGTTLPGPSGLIVPYGDDFCATNSPLKVTATVYRDGCDPYIINDTLYIDETFHPGNLNNVNNSDFSLNIYPVPLDNTEENFTIKVSSEIEKEKELIKLLIVDIDNALIIESKEYSFQGEELLIELPVSKVAGVGNAAVIIVDERGRKIASKISTQ